VARQLIVIIGAGASADCVGHPSRQGRLERSDRQPPLVSELFDDKYRDILNSYPLVKPVAAEVWARLQEGEEALSLENYLREELLNSATPHRRAQYWSVPLYLQELLYQCGSLYTDNPDNFHRLVTALLDLERVVFVTLNYDTILDSVLSSYFAFDSLDSYVEREKVALIKLHGSVNWGRRVETEDITNPVGRGYRNLCHALATNPRLLASDITVMFEAPGPPVAEMRSASDSGLVYPALSVPLGPQDEPSCPPNHVDVLRQTLDQHSYGYELHVLILGYSCLDTTPLDLIKESGSVIKSIVIANGSTDAGATALKRIQEHMPGVAPCPKLRPHNFVEVFDGGFSAFATPAHLKTLVERVLAA
jgi:hypothetical protein